MKPNDDLRRQLAELDELIRSGVLTGPDARAARDRIEAELLSAVLKTGPAPTAPPARPSPRLLLGLVGFALTLTVAGYAWLGNPAGLLVAPGVVAAGVPGSEDHAVDAAQFEAMTRRLAERLKGQPDDADGWAMLGRSYSVIERFDQAAAAYRRVVTLRPQDAQAYADLADAVGMANGRQLDGEPGELVARALVLDADNLKALSLAGTIAYTRGDAAGAARHWERALRNAEPGSPLAQQLQGALADVRSPAGAPPAAPPPTTTASARNDAAAPVPKGVDGPAGGSVQVRVALAPGLAAQAAPNDTVFVFARAAQGSKAPLAIQRLQVKDLPKELTLDDSMAMSPALRLSSVAQVVVGARVSKSGNAMPQPGDLQGLSPPVDVGTRGLQLQIGEVLR